jgi:transposase InsO family protein/transposase
MTDKWLTINEIAELLNLTRGPVIRKAKLGDWPYRSYTGRGGKARRYPLASLPEDVQLAYCAAVKMSFTELQSQLKPSSKPDKKINIPRYSGRGAKIPDVKIIDKTPEKYIRIAAARRKILDAYSASDLPAAQFVADYNNGKIVQDIKEQLGSFGAISCRASLYNWLERYEKYGLPGLAPQYAHRHGGSGASLDEAAKDLIQSLWLDSHKPSIQSVVRDIVQFGYELDYSTVNRYIQNEIPLSVKTFYRQGEKAYHDRFDPYIQRDYTLLKSMEWGCGDHHLFDFVIKHNGRIFRPWLTMFIDMRSRKITGWHIDIIPNTLTIIRALSMSVENCGTFDNLLIDNGKDFRSHWFAGSAWKDRRIKVDKETCDLIEGVLHDCGTKAHFCLPYRGQSKPIERAFGTVIELFSRSRDTYVGSNTATRPDEAKLYWGKINGRDRIEVRYTLEQLRADFTDFVAWFNASWQHSGQGMKSTPDMVFAVNLERKREMPEEMRRYIFSRREKRIIQRSGVTIDGISYYNPQMAQYTGSQIEVRRDINRLGIVSLYSLPERIYLMDAESDVLKDFGIPEENIRAQRTAQRAARAHITKYAKENLRIVKSPAELMAEQAASAVITEERIAVGEVPKRKKYINILD